MMSKTWNWLLYDVPDGRLFILALEHLFAQDSILVMDFSAVPDSLARESETLRLGLAKDYTLVSQFIRTGVSDGNNCVTMRLRGEGLSRVFGSEERWQKDIKFPLTHIHVMRDRTYLMTGYDFGTDDGFMVTQTIPEDVIKQFCSRASCKYKKVHEPL